MKIIVERVRPQNDVALSGRSCGSICSPESWNATFLGPTLESGRSKLRHASLRRQMQNALQEMAEARRLAKEICEPRNIRPELCPAVDHTECIRMQRAPLAFVIVGQEFRLVSGHIHVRGAFRLASFAGQAQV